MDNILPGRGLINQTLILGRVPLFLALPLFQKTAYGYMGCIIGTIHIKY